MKGISITILVLVSVVSIVLSLNFGAANIDVWQTTMCHLQSNDCAPSAFANTIVFDIRLPRVITGFAVGAGLTLAGNILQGVTRNPLADPYLFGIVSGAGLGAVLGGIVASATGIQVPLTVLAFVGALGAVFIVVTVSAKHHWQRIDQVLLAGVAVSFLCTAVTSLLLYLDSPHAANRVIFWLMGSLANADWQAVSLIVPVVLAGAFVVQGLTRQLDALQLSDDAIHALGISISKLRMMLMLLVASMSAVIVAFCGGIGFVGLMVPHIVRQLFGYRNSVSNVACVFAGGTFLVWVDVVARSILPNQEIPIGIITAAIGSVFFIVLMSRRSA
ncbi:FecCD family ABC transporter permease [Echinimonas agarilytica]|uniref:Iron ABC transporter permease n=1 Tax=Echinimonas agarilytica TaxID=1215918 RepID=A0AA41W8Q5_9GAMM|nr:iron ABC transporter permease [Echinimonas agarilytica]MCM2681140.1 iron ABC transporter permease [Echinimonas agarilytica]